MKDSDIFDDLADALKDVDFPQKTIWDELNDWGTKLASWQRFILSHAVRDGTLTDTQVDDAFRLFLREYKLDAGTEELPEISSSVTGRADTSDITPIVLHELRNLENVNAIPKASSLTFGPNLTVIYGHNGAGKSGYARVLSAACFGRSDINILNDIYEEVPPKQSAKAEFVVEKGDSENQTISFQIGNEHPDLKRVSVFDSHIARVRLSKEETLGFQPTGFDIFDEMMRVVGLIAIKMDQTIATRSKPNKFNQLFTSAGRIATELSNLNIHSNIEYLRQLANFGQAEQDRLDEVVRQEQELSTKSPAETLKTLSTAKSNIDKLQQTIADLFKKLDEEAVIKASTMLNDQRTATADAIIAGTNTVKHADLTQIGTETWDSFVNASRKLGLAESDHYPSHGAPCILCHRPLDEPSATLIRRMWGYLDADARQHALELDSKINTYAEQLRSQALVLLPEDSQVRAEISKVAPDILTAFDDISKILSNRRDAIVYALESGQNNISTDGDISPLVEQINCARNEIEQTEKKLSSGKFEEQIIKLKNEHVELQQRMILSNNIQDVSDFIENLVWLNKAERAKPNTRFITEKQKSLFKTLIEGAYKSRLEEECAKLECRLPIEFKARGNIGKTLKALKAKGGHKPEDIFSEGEQRALAIADFLTEASLNPACAALVFDDPVTSMDHQRKERIAVRLAEEGKTRQVIVFTHDLVFLSKLLEAAEMSNVNTVCHTVDWHNLKPGHVLNNESPANSQAYRNTNRAKEYLSRARATAGQEKVDCIRQAAGALRKTLEESVITHLLKGVVRRWHEEVRLGLVSKINWSDELANEVDELLDGTSRLIEGHSNSDEFAGGMPRIETLENLIIRTDSFIKKVKPERTKSAN